MELKFNTLVQLFSLGVIMLISCNDKTKEDSGKLCTEFYLLNKGKNFDGLFDVIIGDRSSGCSFTASRSVDKGISDAIIRNFVTALRDVRLRHPEV